MAALYYYPLFELSDKTSDAQAVIFTCRLNNNSSNVFLLAKTVNTVKKNKMCATARSCVFSSVCVASLAARQLHPAWRSSASW